MSKMGLHDPFGYLTHKLWPNEGPRIKVGLIKRNETPTITTFRAFRIW
jgi:hypothetical protein